MQRKTGSLASARARKRGNLAKKKSDDLESQELGPSLADLPSDMTTEILLRLPVKSIVICKGVCRDYNKLISGPEFAKLHLDKSSTAFIIRRCDRKLISRNIYLLEDEPQELDSEGTSILKLNPTFKLPLRDAKSVLDKQTSGLLVCKTKDHRFDVVNSCNGLLLLCDPYNKDPLVVCNPMTGEFIRLPKITRILIKTLYSGIGFQPKTNEYKVVRMRNYESKYLTVEINVLGRPTWRYVGVYRNIFVAWMHENPTFVNGALHWLIFDGAKCSILYFNIETEKLQLINFSPQILIPNRNQHREFLCIGALRDSLYFCNTSMPRTVEVWIMKKYDTDGSWIRAFRFEKAPCRGISTFWAVKQFEKGTNLLEYHRDEGFNYYDRETNGLKKFLISGTEGKPLEIFPHIPSFVSLKNVIKGDHVEVRNIHSRCARYQLPEERSPALGSAEKSINS